MLVNLEENMNGILACVREMTEVGNLIHAQNTLLQERHVTSWKQINQTNEKINSTSHKGANLHHPSPLDDMGIKGEDARKVINKMLGAEDIMFRATEQAMKGSPNHLGLKNTLMKVKGGEMKSTRPIGRHKAII